MGNVETQNTFWGQELYLLHMYTEANGCLPGKNLTRKQNRLQLARCFSATGLRRMGQTKTRDRCRFKNSLLPVTLTKNSEGV